MSEVKTDKLSPRTGSGTVTLGTSGDTFTLPSGATLAVASGATISNAGTASGFGGGKVLQVVQGTYATQTSTTSTSPVTSNLSASITPSSTSSKILLSATVNSFYTTSSPAGGYLYIYRDGSNIISGSEQAAMTYNGGGSIIDTIGLNYLDSPSSTSSLTYQIYFSKQSGGTTTVHDSGNPSFIILMEIEG